MRAGHKARLARLGAPGPSAAAAQAVERGLQRFFAVACRLIREAMLRAGVDPGCAPALRRFEEQVAGFADTPELQRADAELMAADEDDESADDEDPREWLIAELERAAVRFADGSLPDFSRASFAVLLAWARAGGRAGQASGSGPR